MKPKGYTKSIKHIILICSELQYIISMTYMYSITKCHINLLLEIMIIK